MSSTPGYRRSSYELDRNSARRSTRGFGRCADRPPMAIGPLGPEVLSYDLARTILRDTRFVIPPGLHLTAHGVTSGPLWDRVVRQHHVRGRRRTPSAAQPGIEGLHTAGDRATARHHRHVVNELVDRVADAGRCDIVTDIARPLPHPDHLRPARCTTRGLADSFHDGQKTSSRWSTSTVNLAR